MNEKTKHLEIVKTISLIQDMVFEEIERFKRARK